MNTSATMERRTEPVPHPGANPDRRVVDRRRRPTPMFSRYTFFGGRRAGDRRLLRGGGGQYVDRYSPALFAVLFLIGVLCALDAVFTLLYLQKGGSEANPIMAEVIEWGPQVFLLVKCGITNLGLIVLCLHKNFRYVRAVIASITVMYALLFLYHLYLAAIVP